MSNYSQGKLQTKERNTTWAKVFEYVLDGSVVLDVGCSDGALGKELKRHKHSQVYGIEIDQDDFRAAQKVLDGVFNVNLETTALPKQLANLKFDAIILADVIEHFATPVSTLQKLRDLLKPGGRLIFSLPNMSHMSVRLQLLAGRFGYNETGLLDKTHLHFYDFEEVKRVFHDAGFQIEHNDSTSLPYPPVFLSKKLRELGLRDDGFIKAALDDIEAQTFQFVGYCSVAEDAGNIKPIRLSTTTPEKELVDYIEDLKRQVASLDAAKAASSEQLAAAGRELDQLRQQLSQITGSRAYRFARRARSAINGPKQQKAEK